MFSNLTPKICHFRSENQGRNAVKSNTGFTNINFTGSLKALTPGESNYFFGSCWEQRPPDFRFVWFGLCST